MLTGPQLQEELLKATVFIGLLTQDSLKSSYVLFELGARWGATTGLKPLVAAGLEVSAVKSPLREHHVQSCDLETDLHQFLYEIAERLGLELLRPHFYASQLRRLLERSKTQARANIPVS